MKYAIGVWLALVASLHAGLEFEELSKELSAAADAATVTTDFKFTNKTDKMVTITKSDPGCSCVSVQVSEGKFRYAPGESGTIRANFDMANFSGSVDKAILLWLDNDPAEKPSTVLKLKINIPVLVALEPKTLKWELGAKPEAQKIMINMAEGQKIHVKSVESSSEAFIYKLNTIEDGRRYELMVTPKVTDSQALGVFRVETDCAIQKHRVQQAFAVVRKPSPAETAAKP